MPPRRRSTFRGIVKKPEPTPHWCCVCFDLAGFGLRPPLVQTEVWYCHAHWLLLPSTQQMFAERLKEAMRDE